MTSPVMDCGDNSCNFAIDKGGMRTNGGCRCLADVQISPVFRRTLLGHVAEIRRRVRDAEAPALDREHARIAGMLRARAVGETKRVASVLREMADRIRKEPTP